MGFCRRCGDIVTGTRCKCGGTAVAPTLQWNPAGSNSKVQDRWSQTYVTKPREKSPTRRTITEQDLSTPTSAASSPASTSLRRFPRPQSTSGPVNIGSRVSAHIDKTTASRPSSPLKRTYSLDDDSADILPSPHGSVLAKAYGSVLQPKETLTTFTCSICATPFPPDATIYPDPLAVEGNSRYLCRSCFTSNGGSKGDCESCNRPVLVLKSEGGFIENSGRLWHKNCFRCTGCFKDISDHPMVDLFGKPSCAECFDTCLKRDSPRRHQSPRVDEKRSNLGGLKGSSRSRQGSPALEELEQKLGTLSRSRESSPMVGDKTTTFSRDVSSPSRDSPTRSPLGGRYTSPARDDSPLLDRIRPRADPKFGTPSPSFRLSEGSPVRRTHDKFRSPETDGARSSPRFSDSPTTSPHQSSDEAIEEMKRRFMNSARSSPSSSPKPVSLPSKESQRTPQSRIPVATRGSVSPTLRSAASTSPLSPDSRFLSFADPSSSSTTSLRSKSSVSSFSRDSDILSSELLSTPDPIKHDIPTPSLRSITSMGSLCQEPDVLLSTPDLGSDLSDSTSFSSGPSTPPSLSPPLHRQDTRYNKVAEDSDVLTTTPTPKSKRPSTGIVIPTTISSTAKCSKCNIPLLTVKHGGKFVTVPQDVSSGTPPELYHPHCFNCSVCHAAFEDNKAGQAVFVRAEVGVCHVYCAPTEKVSLRGTKPTAATSVFSVESSNRCERPPATAPPTTTSFPKFGGAAVCPGCHKSVSPMERGVVPGPAGTRWHSSCLVCGGKDRRGQGGRRDKGEPGCGKKLDSAAKNDGDGGVWCRECLLLLPPASPIRSPLVPSHTGSIWAGQTTKSKGIDAQYTGTTTIAKQFTGMGGGESLIRQMTGGSLSPTRQLSSSPTKQLGMMSGTKYGRPKSVIGIRGEGRGMRLVQQMTGRGGDYGL